MSRKEKASPRPGRLAVPPHGGHEERFDLPGPGDVSDGLISGLKRYLLTSYLPTLMHAMFHFMAVMLAFIIGTTWAAREGQLHAIKEELGILRPVAGEFDIVLEKVEKRTRNPLSPCDEGFSVGEKEGYFRVSIWTAIATSDKAFKIDEVAFDELRKGYVRLSAAPLDTKGMNAEQCKTFATNLLKDLRLPHDVIDRHIDALEMKKHALERWFNPEGLVRYVIYAMLAWVVIVLMPPGIFTIAFLQARRRSRRPP